MVTGMTFVDVLDDKHQRLGVISVQPACLSYSTESGNEPQVLVRDARAGLPNGAACCFALAEQLCLTSRQKQRDEATPHLLVYPQHGIRCDSLFGTFFPFRICSSYKRSWWLDVRMQKAILPSVTRQLRNFNSVVAEWWLLLSLSPAGSPR